MAMRCGHGEEDRDPEEGYCLACESKAEMDAENGWLRAAEYDQEVQDQMYYEDAMGFT